MCHAEQIAAYGGTSLPSGWLFCDGKTYDLNDGMYGTSTPTTFSVPDLRGYVIVGVTSMGNNPPNPDFLKDANGASLLYNLNEIYGESTHTLLENELAPHKHQIDKSVFRLDVSNYAVLQGSVQNQNGIGGNGQLPGDRMTESTPSSARPFNIIQPSRALNYIIKY